MNFQTLNRQRKFILLAALAGLIAMFLPWVTVSAGNLFGGLETGDNGAATANLTDSLFGKQAISLSENGMHGSGIIVFLSYLFAIALSLLSEQTRTLEKTSWLCAMGAGAAALLFTIILLANAPTGAMGIAKSSVGYGAWISLLASAAVLASAWLFRTPGYTLKGSIDQLKKDLTIPLFLLALTAGLFYGCSKSNSNSSATPSTTQWTLNGVTYKGVTTGYTDTTSGLGILVSVDAKGNSLSVIFFSHPSANGTYVVTDESPTPANSVTIQMYVYSGGAGEIYTSTGKTGDQLNLTITDEKVKVSFTDITLANGSTTGTGSGTALQQ